MITPTTYPAVEGTPSLIDPSGLISPPHGWDRCSSSCVSSISTVPGSPGFKSRDPSKLGAEPELNGPPVTALTKQCGDQESGFYRQMASIHTPAWLFTNQVMLGKCPSLTFLLCKMQTTHTHTHIHWGLWGSNKMNHLALQLTHSMCPVNGQS